jgi:CheY-like chemotaxis protein
LKKAGLDRPIHHCEDGDEALTFLTGENGQLEERGYPGLILLDLNMPGTDGRDVLAQIKSQDSLKNVPVIILTTSNNEYDIEACYEKGANSYVQKPTVPDDYVAMATTLKKFWFDWASLPGRAY